MKNIVLIGSGNLAEALARAISRTEGATLLQIFARNAKRGTALALENGTAWSSDPRELAAADLYILAVSDAAITTLAESLQAADIACYMAKEKGRNRVQVYHADDSELSLRFGVSEIGHVDVSIGVASYPQHAQSDNLLRAADVALYRAKELGRSRIVSFGMLEAS